MKVKELIDQLKLFDPEKIVKISVNCTNTHDFEEWVNAIPNEVREDIEEDYIYILE